MSKVLLVWSSPISDPIADLFTEVSAKLSVLIEYITQNITKVDSFHLIIPLDYLEQLIKDPVYRFPQLQHIDLYYDIFDDLLELKRRFNLLSDNRIQYHSIRDLPKRLNRIICDNALESSNAFYQDTINALTSSIEDRIAVKKSMLSVRHSSILAQFPLFDLGGIPVMNIDQTSLCFICSSCKLIFQQLYQLACGHRKCCVCVKMQKKCTDCSEVVSQNNVCVYNDEQMIKQNLKIVCIYCKWSGPITTYRKHFDQNHQHLLSCLVYNLPSDNHTWLSSDELSMTSLNGVCNWEISGIDAMKKNPRMSICSAPFYLFPNGYKMCLKFYLNGDVNSRYEYMSLFLVLMRGINDQNLHWPFQYKVTFILLNPISSNYNMSNSFWPGIPSFSLRCPENDMNIPYGISECFRIDLFNNNQHHFIQNDTIHIRFQVDFFTEISSNSALITGASEFMNEEDDNDRIRATYLDQKLCI